MTRNSLKVKNIITSSLFIISLVAFGFLFVSGITSFKDVESAAEGNKVFFVLSALGKLLASLVGVIFAILGLVSVKRKDIDDDLINRTLNLALVVGIMSLVINIISGSYLLKVEANKLDKYLLEIIMNFLVAGLGVVGAGLSYFSTCVELEEQRKVKIVSASVALGMLLVSLVLKLVFLSLGLFEIIFAACFIAAILLGCCQMLLSSKTE